MDTEKPRSCGSSAPLHKSIPTVSISPPVTCGRQNRAPKPVGILMRWKQSDTSAIPAPHEAGRDQEESVAHQRARNRLVQISILETVSEEHKATERGTLKNMFPGLASIIHRSFVLDDFHTKDSSAGLCPLDEIQCTRREQLSQKSRA